MKHSTGIAKFGLNSNEQHIEQAMNGWISQYGNVCEIDTSNFLRPRFISTCDNIDRYRHAIDSFGELWINFNDAGFSEFSFMSAYCTARKHILEEKKHGRF